MSIAFVVILAVIALALALRFAIRKIELRGHSETHNGIRVQEIALTWLRGRPGAMGQNRRQLECAVYVTLKRSN